MNVLDELDAICSEKLLPLEKEFNSLVAHADFDLFDPTSFNEQLQTSAFTSFASESFVCIPELQPNPSLQGCSRFTAPKSDEKVTAALAGAVPKNTQRTTNWALNIWKQWTSYWRQVCHPHDCPPHLYLCTNSEYDQWLSKFVLEIRRADGMPYPPSTLYSICCGLQRYTRDVKPDLNLLKDPQFFQIPTYTGCRNEKALQHWSGSKKWKAEPISISDENLLWEKKLLGDHSARVLLDTMVFYCGMYFALRSGLEHRNLLQSQIVLVEPPGATPYLVYTENSKNNSGGLAQRKVEAKSVAYHADKQNPERCFVRLFKEYKKQLPQTITWHIITNVVKGGAVARILNIMIMM